MRPGWFEREAERLLERIQQQPFRGAWQATAVATVIVTVASGLLMTITDRDRFPSLWDGLWWSAQTVTTVGYGDVLPQSAAGRLLAVLVMMIGVTFITVTSAAIASVFVEAARRRRAAAEGRAGTDTSALAEEVRALAEEVRMLRDRLGEPPEGTRPGSDAGAPPSRPAPPGR